MSTNDSIDAEGTPPCESMGSLCPHFGECGGCETQDVAYEEQLSRKEQALRTLFAPYWQGPIPVDPSPVLWHYRNRMDINFGRKQYDLPPPKGFKRETVLGFKRRGRWYWTLDLSECRIGPPGLPALIAAVRRWARDRRLPAFSSRTKDGFLRILLVREGKRTGQRMVVLVTCEGEMDNASFVGAVQSSFPATSIQRAVHRGFAETTEGELEVLDGTSTIEEVLKIPNGNQTRDLRFRISPFSFFQTNTFATERLYGLVRRWVRETAPAVVYDLYGGSGGIALSCADLVDSVMSVESVPEASEDGRHNAALNSVENVTFVTQKVEQYLRDLRDAQANLAANAAVILDPPRAGLHPKAVKRLLELRPPNVIYVSCKPEILAKQDLPPLLEHYRVRALHAVDLFPHTRHVEALVHLQAPE